MNIQAIKEQCRIDEETGCWNWAGGMSRGKAGSMLPVCYWNGAIHSVPRLVMSATGRRLAKGEKAFRKCRNQACVCPSHVTGGSHKEVGRMLAATGGIRGMHRSIIATKSSRKRSKINMEIANEIRASTGTAPEIAKRFGVTPALVRHVRNGTTWRPVHGLFSFVGRV